MADQREALRQLATQIRDERKLGANTATRVGSLLLALVDAGSNIEELKKLFLSKTSPDSTPHLLSLLGGLGLGKNNKRINDLIRYYDEVDKEEEDKAVPTDADIYSALMTDQRIEEEIGEMDDRFIRKDKKDKAHKHILFEEGITVYELAQMMNIDVKQLATIAQAVCQILRSDRFVDGFSGEGYQIWKDIATGDWNMTLDRLTVRKAMTIYELIIQKIRAVGGMMVVSAANGKVKTVQKVGSNYVFTFEDENMFAGSDLARCQVFTGKDIKYYWVKVSSVSDHRVIVPESEFAGVVPEVGDEWVLMGNTDNKRRQNFILISATEDGQPRFDCYNGVKTKNFEGCLKVRVGNLDGIKDSRFPAELQPSGDGLYGNNCFLTGVFVLVNGKDVLTMFQITEGLIKSEIASVRSEINQKDNYLSNASFSDSLTGWIGNNRVRVFSVNDKLLMFNGNLYANKETFANIIDQGNKSVLRIKNSSVSQLNKDFSMHPEFDEYEQIETDEEGNETVTGKLFRARMFYVSFKYMVRRPGTLRVYFKDEDKTGFEEYESIDCSEELLPSDGFKTMEIAGKWSGTGDFFLSFSGDMYLYSLALADNRLADVEERFKTKFEQTDKMIKLSADEIKNTGKKLEEYHSEFLITARNIRAELSEGLDNLEDGITEAYKGYVDITARDLTIGYTADISDSETKITEAYTGAISISAKGLTAEFTKDITDMEEGITSAYKGYFKLTAEDLVSGFDKKLVDLKTGITSEYKGYFKLTAGGLESGFNKKIDGINGILFEHDSKFNVTAEQISALVTSTNSIDNTIKSSGWITTADGNRLWADKNLVSDLGNTLSRHTGSFHVTSDRIEGIVDRVDITEDRMDVVGTKITQLDKSITLSVNKATGFAIHKDLKFKLGTNGISVYNNEVGEAVSLKRFAMYHGAGAPSPDKYPEVEWKSKNEHVNSLYRDSDTGNHYQYSSSYTWDAVTTFGDLGASQYGIIQISKTVGFSTPGLGGFTFSTQTRANAVFECRFTAMIPIGYTLYFSSNSIGDSYETKWVTNNKGTGKWEEYRHQALCGDSGSFLTTNFFNLTKDVPLGQSHNDYNAVVTWFLKEATVFDLSGYEDPVTYINLTDGLAKIKAENIKFEGAVSANGSFKIHLDGSMESTSGSIGGFEIANGRIGSEASASGAGGGLSITDNFLRVGGKSGYVMIGEDVIPSTAGGAFTSAGRIVNNHSNTGAGWGFDTANYGLFINVSGGTRNYGILSDAPLIAPAFINTQIGYITFGSGSYNVDFTRYSTFVVNATTNVRVALPNENSLRQMFSLPSLPSGFGFVFAINAEGSSANIVLTSLVNANGDIEDFPLSRGDSMTILCYKKNNGSGVAYKVLNRHY